MTQQYDILAEPLFVDGSTISHTFDTDILVPVPVDDATCAAQPRLFAHWYALWRKSEAWVARLKREAETKRELAVARIANQSEGAAAMAAGMAAKFGGKPAKAPKLMKWQVDMTANHSPEYLDAMRSLAKAEETTARLQGFVEALTERGAMLRAVVDLQTGGRR